MAFVANAADASYDLIIVDSTDPFGVGEGLFSQAFYRDCYRVLSEVGILINQHEGAFYDGDAQEMLRAHEKIRAVFPIAEVYVLTSRCMPPAIGILASLPKNTTPCATNRPPHGSVLACKPATITANCMGLLLLCPPMCGRYLGNRNLPFDRPGNIL